MVTRAGGAARGFTLIELALAMVLLAVGLLALTGALAHALQETNRARLLHAALRRAESLADSLASHAGGTSGARSFPGFTLEWDAADCGVPCLRIIGRTPTDSFALVAAIQPDTLP